MSTFQTVKTQDFDHIFDRIGKEWMLISATDGKRTNTMTASWGCCGVLWNKPVAICFIRPQRYTYSIVEESERLSLAFLDEEYRSALTYCGRNSGRDGDKFQASGLTCVRDQGVPFPQEAHTVLICHKLYADNLKKASFLDPAQLAHYEQNDFHRFYICEIEKVLKKEK